ncbi:MAG: pantetheine-phosphate adenylyltransferase [Clostridia bacterium]|nr:pantetheine-phosphate adenylyltransferase [Clostridia bacterium]
MSSDKRKRYAIVPGSFDPMTIGHLDILRRASELYDKVYLAILINPSKDYLFNLETRKKIAEKACADMQNVTVIDDGGLLVDLARKLECSVIIKGVRDEKDFIYEKQMAAYNKNLAPEIETLLLPCHCDLLGVSSTKVRELLSVGDYENAKKILPCGTIEIILKQRNA